MSLRSLADQSWLEDHDHLLRHAPDLAELHNDVNYNLLCRILDERIAMQALIKAWQENFQAFYTGEELEQAMKPHFDRAIEVLERSPRNETITDD